MSGNSPFQDWLRELRPVRVCFPSNSNVLQSAAACVLEFMLFSTVNCACVSAQDRAHRIGELVLPVHPVVFIDRVEAARNAPMGDEDVLEVLPGSGRFGIARRTIHYWIETGPLDRDLAAGKIRQVRGSPVLLSAIADAPSDAQTRLIRQGKERLGMAGAAWPYPHPKSFC